jgi:hypothetical protein
VGQFVAHSPRSFQGTTVTSIYTQAEVVYGFALTVPGRPVCL